MRNSLGFMVNDTNIGPYDLINNLSRLPQMSAEEATLLLDPSDKQNVPKAVSLIQHLSMLDQASPAPSDAAAHRRHIIQFVGKLLGCFVFPFIDIEMSITQQVQSLSTFSHLAAYLNIRHGVACLTGALYCDSQAVIKSIIITIGRLQLIDPDIDFYNIHEGTDRLEGLFSDCRTQDHARNFDIEQLSTKFRVATLINAAYQRNPELDRGHRRLSLKGSLGIDHVNPHSWKGDTRVGSINLRSAWISGWDSANKISVEFFGASASYDFDNTFSKPTTDFLRPTGAWYVGIKLTKDDDRSEVERTTPVSADPEPPAANLDLTESAGPADLDSSPFQIIHPEAAQEQVYQFVNIHVDTYSDSPAVQSAASRETDSSTTGSSDGSPTSDSSMSSFDSNSKEYTVNGLDFRDEDFQDISDGVDIESYFPETVEDIEAEVPPANLSKTMDVEGQKVLIDAYVATLSPKYWKRVTMRTFRAQGRVMEDFHKSKFQDLFDAEDIEDQTLMKVTDLGGFLTTSGDKICLAIMEVTGFRFQIRKNGKDKALRTSAKYSDLVMKSSKITVIGQLIEIQECESPPSLWTWPKRYLKLDLESETDLLTRSQFSLEIPSVLIHLLAQHILANKETLPQGQKLRWAVTTDELEGAMQHAWEHLDPNSDSIMANLNLLPIIKNPQALPYRGRSGNCFALQRYFKR